MGCVGHSNPFGPCVLQHKAKVQRSLLDKKQVLDMLSFWPSVGSSHVIVQPSVVCGGEALPRPSVLSVNGKSLQSGDGEARSGMEPAGQIGLRHIDRAMGCLDAILSGHPVVSQQYDDSEGGRMRRGRGERRGRGGGGRRGREEEQGEEEGEGEEEEKRKKRKEEVEEEEEVEEKEEEKRRSLQQNFPPNSSFFLIFTRRSPFHQLPLTEAQFKARGGSEAGGSCQV